MSIGYSDEWKNRTYKDAVREVEQAPTPVRDDNSARLAAQVRRLEVLLFCNCLAVIGIGIIVFVEVMR